MLHISFTGALTPSLPWILSLQWPEGTRILASLQVLAEVPGGTTVPNIGSQNLF